jgi:hypothetical protein
MIEKFFLLGCPRSGTTMLQQALNRHSGIVIPPETKYFFSFFRQSKKKQAAHVRRINGDLKIHLPTPERRIDSVAEGRAFYDLMARQYVSRQGKKDVVCFGEKTPEHTGRMPVIRELFPTARIIVLYRDGRDVASSLSRMPWMSPNLYVNFALWLYYHRVAHTEENKACPWTYFARYEDIVANPEKELRGILQFLGLDYEPAVAQECGNREGVPQRELAWKSRALQPITTNRVGAFQDELTSDQIGMLERMGGDTLLSLGYPLVATERRSLSPRFVLSFAYHFAKLLYRLPTCSLVNELLCRLVSRKPAEQLSHGAPTDSIRKGNREIAALGGWHGAASWQAFGAHSSAPLSWH